MDGAFDNERDNEQRGAATGNRRGGFRRLDEPVLEVFGKRESFQN